MTLKCVAIDDEPLALKLIESYVDRIPSLTLVNTFEDALSGAEFLNCHPVDLLFLDVNMPDISGIDLAKAITAKPMIIFTTAYKEFAFEGFQLEAVDYLLKPVEFEGFLKAVNKALSYKRFLEQRFTQSEADIIYVHSAYKLIKIQVSEIEYIESMEDYVKIHTGEEKPVLTLLTLKKILEMLPQKQFVRIHRSYVIPVSGIKAILHKKVQLLSVQLPIGDRYADQMKEMFKG